MGKKTKKSDLPLFVLLRADFDLMLRRDIVQELDRKVILEESGAFRLLLGSNGESRGGIAELRYVESRSAGREGLEVLEVILKLDAARSDGEGDGAVAVEAAGKMGRTVRVLPLLADDRSDLRSALPRGCR